MCHGMATYFVSWDGNLLCAKGWQLTTSWDGNLLCVMGWQLTMCHGIATYHVSWDGNLLCVKGWQLTMCHGMATYYVSWDGNLLCVMGSQLTSVSASRKTALSNCVNLQQWSFVKVTLRSGRPNKLRFFGSLLSNKSTSWMWSYT